MAIMLHAIERYGSILETTTNSEEKTTIK